MNLKHTPGPWKVMENGFSRFNNYPTVYSADSELRYIAICADFLNINPTDNKANARLIAAAPEMLDALIESYKKFKIYEIEVDDCRPDHHIKFMDEIKQIIEKATGLKIEEVLK